MSILLAACLILAVHDGDTVTAKCEGRAHLMTVRVAEIDAPEYKSFSWGDQPGRDEARNEAVRLCLHQPAKLRLYKFDPRTQRWIAYVECRGMDLGTQLVAQGLAWTYLPAKRSEMLALQKAAQDQRVGLWAAGAQSLAPSVWRKLALHQCPSGPRPKCLV